MIKINEYFQSIQGEATYTGTPCTFIRLQGCSVGCHWCDTKHTWDQDHGDRVDQDRIAAKELDSKNWADYSIKDILGICKDIKHVVITGGEPLEQDITEMALKLIYTGHTVQIETSGTVEIPRQLSGMAWITVSPKIGMKGGKELLGSCVDKCNEFKMPIGRKRDIDLLLSLIAKHKIPERKVWLQPISASKSATELCIEAAKKFGWRLSIQTHKFIGVR